MKKNKQLFRAVPLSGQEQLPNKKNGVIHMKPEAYELGHRIAEAEK